MKKLVFYFAMVLLPVLFFSCEKEKDNTDNTNQGTTSQLSYSEYTILFYDYEPHSLFISSHLVTTCTFQVISSPDWLHVYPENGQIYNNIAEITLTPDDDYPANTVLNSNLVIMHTYGQDTIALKGYFGLQIPDSLVFGAFDTTRFFFIPNKSNLTVSYSLTSANEYISIDSATGTIPPDGLKKITVRPERQEMLTDTYFSMIYVTLENDTDTVNVKIDNFGEEHKQMLSTDVVDAEYSKTRDILVYASTYPPALNVFNPLTGSIESIDLSYIPTCVSVAQDGLTAVAGHDGHITTVDLVSGQIIATHNVSCFALDVVLASNQWVYVFPKDEQWARIRCIDTSVPGFGEVLHTGSSIYAGTKARLHPSGKYIYGADNGLSPSDVEKYDIQNGGAVYLYDSPYHGDYGMNGDLWFSEEGERLFTRGKTVLFLSELQSQDMLYNGSINLGSGYNYNQIMWLDHSLAKNNLYIISSGDDYWDSSNKPYIYVYNALNLLYKSEIELEKYLVPDNNGGGTLYEAEPYFTFSNSPGDSLYVLTKATGSGLLHEWAIQTFPVE